MTNEEVLNLAIELGFKSPFIVKVDGPAGTTDKVASYFVLTLIQNWLIKTHKVIVSVNPSVIPEWIKFNYRVIDGSLGRFDERVFSNYDQVDHKEALRLGTIWALNYVKEKHERATQANN